MELKDRLYELRKKSGLSQEQLAEKLDVSRQAVSKWESGSAVPESGKLIAISRFFGVSLDYLVNGAENEPAETPAGQRRTGLLPGIAVFAAGMAGLVIWGLVAVFAPAVSDKISDSSIITLDGSGIFLLLCAAATVAGTVLLFRGSRKR